MPFQLENPGDEAAPDYDEVVSSPIGTVSGRFVNPFATPSNNIASTSKPADKERIIERVIYTYHLNACSVHLQIIIAVEPVDSHSGQYTFTLSVKAGGIERSICDPVVMKLFSGPHQLDFAAFLYPPKASLPADCLYCVRVWLRTGQVDHKLFSDELWVGMDPDFRAIGDASYAQLKNSVPFMLTYQGVVGRAQVNFIVRWIRCDRNLYKVSLEYEAGGAGSILFDDHHIRLDPECDPRAIAFVIYSVPASSTPPNASHRLRLWIRTPAWTQSPASSVNSFEIQSFIYQRLWKSDNFKLGSELNFEALSSKLVMGIRDARGPKIERVPQSTSTAPRTPLWLAESGSSTSHSQHSWNQDAGNTL